MLVSKKFGFVLTASLLVLLQLGCSSPEQQVGVTAPQALLSGSSGESVEPPDISIVKRFQDAAPQNRTAVESAMELLEKHAELSRQAAELDRKNQSLLADNDRLKAQAASLEAELKQSQKELTEANDLLVEMRIELNNWKTSILGFRDEIRQAETAQLEALLKILGLLGGEVTPDLIGGQSAQGQDTEPTTATGMSPQQPDQAKSQETPTPGESNG